MTKLFSRNFQVRWSEMGAAQRVRASQYMDYLVETAYDWGASNQLGFEESSQLGLIWVILETDIHFLRPLRYPESFDFSIWMLEWRRVRGTRAFELRLKETDKVIAHGVQKIASLDAQSFRPKQPPAELIEGFRMAEPPAMEQHPFPSLDAVPENAFELQRHVQWGAIDALEHLNHGRSLGYVEDVLAHFLAAQDWPLERLQDKAWAAVASRVHVRYREAGYWNEALRVRYYPLELTDTGAINAVLIEKESDGKVVLEATYAWDLMQVPGDKRIALPEKLRSKLQSMI
jgi:acyl-CoA thioesterase FadM